MTVRYNPQRGSHPLDRLAAAILVEGARQARAGDPDAQSWLTAPDGGLHFRDVLNLDAPIEAWAACGFKNLNHYQPAAAGPNTTPLRTNGKEKHMTDQEELTTTPPPGGNILDEEAQAEYSARAAKLMQEVLAHMQQRRPSPELQAKLRQQYQTEVAQPGMTANQKVDIRRRFRGMGLRI